jgi:hypothetical protein
MYHKERGIFDECRKKIQSVIYEMGRTFMSKISIDRDDLFDAIRLGTKQAVLEMCESEDIIRVDQFMEQIRQGTQDAIWAIANNATSSPCADFYDSIKEGVKDSMSSISLTIREDE